MTLVACPTPSHKNSREHFGCLPSTFSREHACPVWIGNSYTVHEKSFLRSSFQGRKVTWRHFQRLDMVRLIKIFLLYFYLAGLSIYLTLSVCVLLCCTCRQSRLAITHCPMFFYSPPGPHESSYCERKLVYLRLAYYSN